MIDNYRKTTVLSLGLLFFLIILCETRLDYTPRFTGDAYHQFTNNVTRLGPPYIAYDFSPPVISGFSFFLVSRLTSDYLVYKLIISCMLGILWLSLILPSINGREKYKWAFLWFLAPSFLLYGLRNWNSMPSVLTAISIILLNLGTIELSAFSLALACSSSFYPALVLPVYFVKMRREKRAIFLFVFILFFMLVNFPFEVLNFERWINSYVVNVAEILGERNLYYSLLTMFLFAIGYAVILYREKSAGKSSSQLVFMVLILFVLINGVCTPAANLWLLPFVGLMQLNPFLFFLFDFLSLFMVLFSFPQYLVIVIRSILLSSLFIQVWKASPPREVSLVQCVSSISARCRRLYNEFNSYLAKTPTFVILILLIIFPSVTILYRLDDPGRIHFDEKYYIDAARSIMVGEEDPNFVHPPLGKMLMALGMFLLGKNNPFGWRLIGALLAILCSPAMYLIGERLYGSRKIGLISSLLLDLDFLFFTQARIAMLDIYVLAFSLFGVLFYLLSQQPQRLSYLLFSGVFFGLATSSKLPGVLPLFTCLVHGLIKNKKEVCLKINETSICLRIKKSFIKKISILVAALIFVPFTVYVASYLPFFLNTGWGLNDFLSHQSKMLSYSVELPGSHPYMSEPWTWPFMVCPLFSYYETLDVNGIEYVAAISHLGNPVVWYVGFIVAVVCILDTLEKRGESDVFVCVWFLSTWLVFFPLGIAHAFFASGRAQYIFYFLQSVPALCLMLANFLEKSDKVTHFPVSNLFLGAAVITFALCYPVISAYPVWVDYVKGLKILRLNY